jgi:ribonucleotide reductase alpha subunit
MSNSKELSFEIWDTTYKSPEDTCIEDTWERQAKACAAVETEDKREQVYQDFKWLLNDFKGIAGGRITANLGVPGRESTTLMNCFVHNPVDIDYNDSDSINGIYDMLKVQAHTLKSEGGYGMNFSWIRPSGSYVKGIDGRTPGVLKFMELWDKSSEIITMGSEAVVGERKKEEKKKIRKGAQMGICSVWHPDVLEFIDAKLVPNRLTKFNLSVGITEGFIDAVKNDLDWDLRFPDTGFEKYKTEWFGDIYDWESKGYPVVVFKTLKARDLWDKIMKSTYTRNDPGVIFLDIANKLNPLSYAENIFTTNPCFSGDTLIAVADGRKAVSIKELADIGDDVQVYSYNGIGDIEIKIGCNPRITCFNKKLIKILFDDGSSVKTTEDHKFLLSNGYNKKALDLCNGDKIPSFKKVSENICLTQQTIVAIEGLEGLHTVYNITVEENHTIGIITHVGNGTEGVFIPQCGEIAMSTGVCNLFSLNLIKYLKKNSENKFEFDFEMFKKAVSIAVRFSDNINDISRVPDPAYKKSMIEKRRIGIGVLSLGSLLYILGLRYGSPESLKLVEDIFRTKCETEVLTSSLLGKEKGSFALFDKEKHFSTYWWNTLPISNEVKRKVEEIGEMRNSHHSANAPTGNMSIYAGVVSGGIEPVFMKEYVRWSIVPEITRAELRSQGFDFPDVNKGQWFETEHLKLSKKGTDDVLLGSFNGINYQVDKNRGLTKESFIEDYGWTFVKENCSKQEFEENVNSEVYATTEDLSVENHVSVLKVLARYVNMNSSKTVNIPSDYPYEDFKNLYMDAWNAGIKGITSYRAGSMTAVLEKKEEKRYILTLSDGFDIEVSENDRVLHFGKEFLVKDLIELLKG